MNSSGLWIVNETLEFGVSQYISPTLSKSNKETRTLTWKTRLYNLNKATPKSKYFLKEIETPI